MELGALVLVNEAMLMVLPPLHHPHHSIKFCPAKEAFQSTLHCPELFCCLCCPPPHTHTYSDIPMWQFKLSLSGQVVLFHTINIISISQCSYMRLSSQWTMNCLANHVLALAKPYAQSWSDCSDFLLYICLISSPTKSVIYGKGIVLYPLMLLTRFRN